MRALIVGASRGLGLELVFQLLQGNWQVDATVRDTKGQSSLAGLPNASQSNLAVHFVDIANVDEVRTLAKTLAGVQFDLVFVNAGIFGPSDQSALAIGASDIGNLMQVNAIGPMQVAALFKDAVTPETGVFAFTSSIRGSIGSVRDASGPLYKASKAALNVMARSLFPSLKERGTSMLLFHPGWVRTSMGGSQAPVGVEESVAGMLALVEAHRGKATEAFLDYQGNTLPW
jgi:NAD(P)-dependent dehydrogenase (short-subunit alcohol dehydrogenase family)